MYHYSNLSASEGYFYNTYQTKESDFPIVYGKKQGKQNFKFLKISNIFDMCRIGVFREFSVLILYSTHNQVISVALERMQFFNKCNIRIPSEAPIKWKTHSIKTLSLGIEAIVIS